ncbi:MAG: AraC family transcriptional regulator [Rhodanobacteraceae bacterium]|nr:AraC family transcriptional regulator [Rhodanobacteraceae bacterium]
MASSTAARVSIHRHQSALGCWAVAVCQPDPRLAGIVAAMWFGEGSVSYARDRILPSGQSQLLINLGPPQYRIEAGPPERRIPFRDIWYSGLHQGPIDTEAPHGNALLGVAFTACGGYPWLGHDLSGLADRIIALADALGDGVLALRQRLLDTPDIAQRFELVERWLIARLNPRAVVHPAVRWAVDRIAASGGHVSVDALARQTGYTRKHLALLFQRQVGFGPKALARVHRFKSALALLGAVDEVPWATLAAQCGYYDQSHLVRDFRAFSGYAPSEFLRRGRPDGGSVVVL